MEFNSDIHYGGYTLSNINIKNIVYYAKKYHILPTGMICQMYLESFWGNAGAGANPELNNWGGITWFSDNMFDGKVSYSKGSPRPSNEGGYYVKFHTMSDYFHAHAWLLSDLKYGGSGIYKVADKITVSDYAKGLFRYGGAIYDYAVSWQNYEALMLDIESGIIAENPTFNNINKLVGLIGSTQVKLVIPAKGATENNITSPYGWRTSPFTGDQEFHTGIDLALGMGSDIIGALNGVVKKVNYPYPDTESTGGTGGYGNYIDIEHGNGILTRYAHLKTIYVTEGQKVTQGYLIGLMGSTGNSTGSHLHFELHLPDTPLDPLGMPTVNPYPYLFGNALLNIEGYNPQEPHNTKKKYKFWLYD